MFFITIVMCNVSEKKTPNALVTSLGRAEEIWYDFSMYELNLSKEIVKAGK